MTVQMLSRWPAVFMNGSATSCLGLLPRQIGTHVLVKEVGLVGGSKNGTFFMKTKFQRQRLDQGRGPLSSGDQAVRKGSLTSPGLLC